MFEWHAGDISLVQKETKWPEDLFMSGVGDCCWPVDSSCRSPARPSPPHQTWRLRRPMTSRQRVKPRPPQVWTANSRLTSRLFFTCYVWHLFCLFLTAPTRITSCCEETAQTLRGCCQWLFFLFSFSFYSLCRFQKLLMKDHMIVFCHFIVKIQTKDAWQSVAALKQWLSVTVCKLFSWLIYIKSIKCLKNAITIS